MIIIIQKYDFYQNEIDKYTTNTEYWNIINNLTGMNKTDSTITKIKYIIHIWI